jgi:hypothetical protein
MIKIITTIALFICFSVNGQTQKVDSRLLGKYSAIELQKMQTADPDQYQFLVNSVERGLFIGDIPQEKAKDIVFDGILNIDPAGSYTYISLNKEILDRYQYFKIEGTNKMLVIQPKIFLVPNHSK